MPARRSSRWLAVALGAVPALALADQHEIEGALSLIVNHSAEYLGAARSSASLRPGFFIRWGRFTLSSGGGFAASRREGQSRGFGYDLRHTENVDLSLGLRMDSGRSESDSDALAGMGDVPRTVRLRVAGEWRFTHGWKVAGGWTIDAFGRGGGNLGEIGVRHERELSRRTTLTTGIVATIAGDRYLQTYFGVTPEQSARTGYPVHTPAFGVRDVAVYLSMRKEFDEDWVAVAGIGGTRLLGDARTSPLTRRAAAASFSAGLGYRF